MELTHAFTVPVGADEAFEVLTDIERIAPCMPGAAIDSVDGDDFTGTVKVKVGPMQVTYRGKASYAELDREEHRAVIEARAQETRGSGTANATISASLDERSADETEVTVVSNLAITGRPAQFGRGVMNEVGAKLLDQFADCLSSKLSGEDEAVDDATEAAEDAEAAAASGTPAVGSNGSSAAASDQAVTQQVGAAPPQPAGAATAAAATPAPSAAAATSGATPAASDDGATTDTHAGNRATTPTQTTGADVEAIDLFEVAGPSVAKRAAPVAVGLLILLFILWRRRS